MSDSFVDWANGAAGVVSFVSLLITALGFFITILQIYRSAQAIRETKAAASEALDEMNRKVVELLQAERRSLLLAASRDLARASTALEGRDNARAPTLLLNATYSLSDAIGLEDESSELNARLSTLSIDIQQTASGLRARSQPSGAPMDANSALDTIQEVQAQLRVVIATEKRLSTLRRTQ